MRTLAPTVDLAIEDLEALAAELRAEAKTSRDLREVVVREVEADRLRMTPCMTAEHMATFPELAAGSFDLAAAEIDRIVDDLRRRREATR